MLQNTSNNVAFAFEYPLKTDQEESQTVISYETGNRFHNYSPLNLYRGKKHQITTEVHGKKKGKNINNSADRLGTRVVIVGRKENIK